MFAAGCALEGSIVDRFDEAVRRFPERLAIQDTEVSLTYAKLASLVDRIACATAAATSERTGPVAILLPANAHFPAAMLGVMAAGRAYLPLDAEFPVERNELIIAEAGACAVISGGEFARDALRSFPSGVPVIDIDGLPEIVEPTSRAQTGSEDLAAIYYTSGSTGRPEGIVWDHRSILHHIKVFTDVAQISCADRMLMVASLSAFASYRNVYSALLNGASVHILPPRRLGLAALIKEIRVRTITIYHSVPTLVRTLAENLGAGERLETIRFVKINGDRLRWSDVDACRRCFAANVPIWTSLSSTETGMSICGFVDEALRSSAVHPPVGLPVDGCKVAIVDDNGQPVANDAIGRIVVTSRWTALGYWQGSTRKIRHFPSDPADPKARVFATGDLGRRRADGLIEYIGRKDDQIKLNGCRIEPAEVENALAALPQVKEATVVVRRDENSVPLSLAAYVILRSGIRGLLPRHVQALLAQRLPRHMIPANVYLVDELPRLPNFKVDRSTLAKIDSAQSIEIVARNNQFFDEVAGIFEEVIGRRGATADDTVASLGGDSLKELSVFAELERRYGVAIPDDMINDGPTIGSIACWIEGQMPQLGVRAR
jgi:amino acid adenylation domain-containing protein